MLQVTWKPHTPKGSHTVLSPGIGRLPSPHLGIETQGSIRKSKAVLTISACFDGVPGSFPILDRCHELVGPRRMIFMLVFQTCFISDEMVSTWSNPTAKKESPSTTLALHTPSDGVFTTSQGSHPTATQLLENLWFF